MWVPVFLILTASFTPMVVQSVSLAGNFTPSQYMVWFSFGTWAVMAEGCNSITESFFRDQVYFYSSSVLTSLLCSFSLTPYLLSVSPWYTSWQSLHGTWYTTPDFSCGVRLSFGCTSILLSVRCGFLDIATPWHRKTWLRASETCWCKAESLWSWNSCPYSPTCSSSCSFWNSVNGPTFQILPCTYLLPQQISGSPLVLRRPVGRTPHQIGSKLSTWQTPTGSSCHPVWVWLPQLVRVKYLLNIHNFNACKWQ